MRITTIQQQNDAATEGMRGFLIGGLKWGLLGTALVGAAHAFGPAWFKAQRLQPKFYVVMAFALGGGAYESDQYFTRFERRGRARMVEAAERERLKILYGKPKGEEQLEKVST